MNFMWGDIFVNYSILLTLHFNCVTLHCYIELLDSLMSSPGQKRGGYGHLMARFDKLIHIVFVRDAEKRVRGLTHVFLRVIVKLATFSRRINAFSYPPQATELKKKDVIQRNKVTLHKRTQTVPPSLTRPL